MLSTFKSVSKLFQLSLEVVMDEVFENSGHCYRTKNDITEQINLIIHLNIPKQ